MNAVDRRSWVLRQLDASAETIWGVDPTDYDPEHLATYAPWINRFYGPGRYFDTHIEGFDRVPDAPCLFVGNHSGGTTIPDVYGFFQGWYDHFGYDRPIHGLGHETIFSNRFTGEFFAKGGVLRARRDLAERVLREHRRDLFVMPGGDRDVWRPYAQRFQVQFAGRTGYARTAIETGTPIVPVAHVGSHSTLFVLTDGHRLARAVGLQRIARASVWPIHLSLPFGLTFGPMPHLPPPARFLYKVGAPIPPPAHTSPGTPASDEDVRAHDATVRAALQDLLKELSTRDAGVVPRLRSAAAALGSRVRRRLSRRDDDAV